MQVTNDELEKLIEENLKLISDRNRLDRFLLHQTLGKLTSGNNKKDKLYNLEMFEMNIANRLSEHVKGCKKSHQCEKEICMSNQLEIINRVKREIIDKKTFWENTKNNPIGIGILLIGIGNLLVGIGNITIALLHAFKIIN